MTRSLSAVATFLTTIALVDVAARAVLGTVDVNPTHAKSNGPGAPSFAQDTDVSPDGRTLYVSRGYLGDVVAFDISSRRLAPALTLVATIPVGDAPGWAEVADGGRVCLVANTRSDDLSIVSVPRRTEILRLPVGNGPKHITVARIPAAVIASFRLAGQPDASN